MDRNCNITFKGNCVGTAEIKRLGLYYRFRCVCTLPKSTMYRLWADCDRGKINLGICLPQGQGFMLDTQIPVSRIGEGDITVYALDKDSDGEVCADHAADDKPFEKIADLDKAYLRLTEKGPKIYIKA